MTFRLPTALTRTVLCVGAAALACAPTAVAQPGYTVDAPVYAGFQPVDPKPFQTYSTYGGGGVQFTTPSGLLCQIVVISRGEFAYATCFGDLHGAAAGSNLVTVDTGGAGKYSTTTRAQFLTAETVDNTGVHSGPIPDTGFPPLAAGSALSFANYLWAGTCAVDADTTRCTVSSVDWQHKPDASKSFVLGPTDTTFS